MAGMADPFGRAGISPPGAVRKMRASSEPGGNPGDATPDIQQAGARAMKIPGGILKTSPNSVLGGLNDEFDMCPESPDFCVTPKESVALAHAVVGFNSNCPQTPHRPRTIRRMDSLAETKLLTVTKMKRTSSILTPGVFQFHAHFDFLRLIGRSPTSEVYLVRGKTDGVLYAVKRSLHGFKSRLDRDRYCREIKAVANLPPHPNVVGHFRGWQEEMHFFIQMELCDGGSLTSVMASMSEPMTERMLWRLARDVAEGLKFIHEHSILHLDIKPDNIFLDGAGAYKVGDFGLAVLDKEWDWEEGDGAYVAPELLADAAEPTAAADVFSMGAMLFECATGEKLPRSEAALEGAMARLRQLRSLALVDLVGEMLLQDPTLRPSTSDILLRIGEDMVTPTGRGAGGGAGSESVFGSQSIDGSAPHAGLRGLEFGRESFDYPRLSEGMAEGQIPLTRSDSVMSDDLNAMLEATGADAGFVLLCNERMDEEGAPTPTGRAAGGWGGAGMTPMFGMAGQGNLTPVKPRREMRWGASEMEMEMEMDHHSPGSPPLPPMRFSFS